MNRNDTAKWPILLIFLRSYVLKDGLSFAPFLSIKSLNCWGANQVKRLIRIYLILTSVLLVNCGPAFIAEQNTVSPIVPQSQLSSTSGVLKSAYCDFGTASPAGQLASKATASEKLFEGFGGTAVDSKSWLARSTVLLTSVYRSTTTNRNSMYVCTAMLLDRDVLLTAAHCVADKAGETLIEMRAFFDTQPECNANNELNYGSGTIVSQRIVHPKYEGVGYPFLSQEEYGDLAMLKLQKDAPTTWSTIKLSADQVPSEFGQILSAGFGRSTPDPDEVDPSGLILRFAYLNSISAVTAKNQTSALNAMIKDFVASQGSSLSSSERSLYESVMTIQNHFTMSAGQDYLYVDQTQGTGICSGDSGGAAYYIKNGKYYVVGVASMVGNATYVDSPVCAGYAAYTQVLRYRNWLETSFSQLKKINSTVAIFE